MKDYRSALAKGLGRVLQHALQNGRLFDEAAVLDACTHSRVHDPQVEERRAAWLMEILDAGGAAEALRPDILSSLKDVLRKPSGAAVPTWDVDQICDLLVIFAQRGCRESRELLHDVFENQIDGTAPWLGEGQLLALEGRRALPRIIAVRLGQAQSTGEDSDLRETFERLHRRFEAQTIEAALVSESHGHEYLGLFRGVLEPTGKEGPEPNLSATRVDSVEKVIARIRDSRKPRPGLVYWGKKWPNDSALIRIAALLDELEEPVQVANVLRVLSGRKPSRFSRKWLELTRATDENVRYFAFRVLRYFGRSDVRQCALDHLAQPRPDVNCLLLLFRNFEDGDGKLIASLLKETPDQDSCHGLTRNLVDLFEINRTPEAEEAMLFVFEYGPCSNCRERALQVLIDLDRLPLAIREECGYDANPNIRKLVAGS